MTTTMKTVLRSFAKSKLLAAREAFMQSQCQHCGPRLQLANFRYFSVSRVSRKQPSEESYENDVSIFGRYEKVSLHTVSEKRTVPAGITRPDYCSTPQGVPPKPIPKEIRIHTEEEISLMRESCRLAKYILERTLREAKVGVTTDDLDKFAHSLIIEHSAYPSPLGYRQFPKSICTSVNNVACHGIPDNRPLLDGDVISIDVMVFKDGFHGDCCGTALVGNVDEKGQHLVRVANKCTTLGTQICGPGVPFSDIGKVIEDFALDEGLTVVPYFTGHGVGRNIHQKPDIYHYERFDDNPTGNVMKPGMIFTVEPVIAQGVELVTVLSDGWTAVTADSGRAAQFENTILITPAGHEILTTSDNFQKGQMHK